MKTKIGEHENLITKMEGELSDLDFCEFHSERVKHFYCICHKTITCRLCTQMKHNKKDCMIIDLYEVENIPEFLRNVNFLEQETGKEFDKEEKIKFDNFMKEGNNQENENLIKNYHFNDDKGDIEYEDDDDEDEEDDDDDDDDKLNSN